MFYSQKKSAKQAHLALSYDLPASLKLKATSGNGEIKVPLLLILDIK